MAGFSLLVVAICVQVALAADFRAVVGEFVTLLVMGLYMVVACIRRGIWDRRFEMSGRANVAISLVTGIFVGVSNTVTCYVNYHNPVGSLLAGGIGLLATFALSFALLSIAMGMTKAAKEKIEAEPSDADELPMQEEEEE